MAADATGKTSATNIKKHGRHFGEFVVRARARRHDDELV